MIVFAVLLTSSQSIRRAGVFGNEWQLNWQWPREFDRMGWENSKRSWIGLPAQGSYKSVVLRTLIFGLRSLVRRSKIKVQSPKSKTLTTDYEHCLHQHVPIS
mgnify:CR=1 FL=1